MPLNNTTTHPPTKFYQQDIVQLVTSPFSYGIILRCWHDAEDPQDSMSDPLMRPLQRGEVGVSFLSGRKQEILPESELRLVDRTIQPGDFCKRSIDDVCSGVVTNLKVKGRVQHAITGELVQGWRTRDEFENRTDVEIGEYVIYNDWVGQVIEFYDEYVVEVSSGQLVRLQELSPHLHVGDKSNDILPRSVNGVQNLLGLFFSHNRAESGDTVIAVKHTVLAVCWLAFNQSLDPAEAQHRQRPKRFWSGNDISKLTVVQSRFDSEMHVGDRVYFKDATGLPKTTHGQEEDPAGMVVVQAFMVTETQTTLDVLWQDGTQETLKSTDIIPYLNPDEYDCWPGDHVFWKGEDEKRPAVVQSVNAVERTASILFPGTRTIELASLLELDTHGSSDLNTALYSASDDLGVRRGDFVFIHCVGTTNGFEKPRLPQIGELEAWVREGPSLDGHLSGWRKQMSNLGTRIATRPAIDDIKEGKVRQPVKGEGSLLWFGEVTGLNLDGSVEVTHPDLTIMNYPLERLTKFHDALEQLEDYLWEDDVSDNYYEERNIGQIWSMDESGVWHPDNANENEWEELEDDEDDVDVDSPGLADESTIASVDGGHNSAATSSNSESGMQLHRVNAVAKLTATMELPVEPSRSSDVLKAAVDQSNLDEVDGDNEGMSWKRFDILPSAPIDHAYYASPPMQPSKSFLGRLTKEYRALASSLPESIIVRTYEDRADLLRSLIIGPENTPYEDAPFVIDWMLDSNFPHSPPVAHFLSWTNGNGRVNPNLYEDGKVCLSILGTWAGDRNETWSAARSSLLQAFISIQGLVLVKEPWFCEPAYEKLRGTEEGIVNSRLYNEKAYVLSRGFVRRALEIPLGGLESEINWIYFTDRRLGKVIHEACLLIEKSKDTHDISEVEQERAVPRLTAGGIISLERTLRKLQVLYSHTQS